MPLTTWFTCVSLGFILIRACGYLFGPPDRQSGWKIADTNALVAALLAIAAAVKGR